MKAPSSPTTRSLRGSSSGSGCRTWRTRRSAALLRGRWRSTNRRSRAPSRSGSRVSLANVNVNLNLNVNGLEELLAAERDVESTLRVHPHRHVDAAHGPRERDGDPAQPDSGARHRSRIRDPGDGVRAIADPAEVHERGGLVDRLDAEPAAEQVPSQFDVAAHDLPCLEVRIGKAADLLEPACAEEIRVGRAGRGARGELSAEAGPGAEDAERSQRRGSHGDGSARSE